jgi:uncharacterized protein
MKFQLDAPGGLNVIRGYAPGNLRVGDQAYMTSVILSPTSMVAPWRPATVADLAPQDLQPLLDLEPEVVLLGTGATQQFPEPRLLRALYEHGVGVEVMDTSAACRTFNVLAAEGRSVAAALIV